MLRGAERSAGWRSTGAPPTTTTTAAPCEGLTWFPCTSAPPLTSSPAVWAACCPVTGPLLRLTAPTGIVPRATSALTLPLLSSVRAFTTLARGQNETPLPLLSSAPTRISSRLHLADSAQDSPVIWPPGHLDRSCLQPLAQVVPSSFKLGDL